MDLLPSSDPAGETLVARTAAALGRLSLARDEGSFIGAEEELLAQFGVSRPTLRQAAKIAENDRLVTVRRGVKGGLYAARPDASHAIRTLTRYLRLQGATIQHVMLVHQLVGEEAAAMAAACPDEELRAELSAFARKIPSFETPREMIRGDTEMAQLIAAMSKNPAIELVMAISYSFGHEEHGLALYREPAEREQARKMQTEVCRVILDGDADVARLMMRRRAAIMSEWLGREVRGSACL